MGGSPDKYHPYSHREHDESNTKENLTAIMQTSEGGTESQKQGTSRFEMRSDGDSEDNMSSGQLAYPIETQQTHSNMNSSVPPLPLYTMNTHQTQDNDYNQDENDYYYYYEGNSPTFRGERSAEPSYRSGDIMKKEGICRQFRNMARTFFRNLCESFDKDSMQSNTSNFFMILALVALAELSFLIFYCIQTINTFVYDEENNTIFYLELHKYFVIGVGLEFILYFVISRVMLLRASYKERSS